MQALPHKGLWMVQYENLRRKKHVDLYDGATPGSLTDLSGIQSLSAQLGGATLLYWNDDVGELH